MKQECRFPFFFSIRMVLAISLIAVTSSHAASFEARDLRCDDREAPLGLDSAQPVLSWSVFSETRSFVQSACQVVVASAPELLDAGRADIWDSGKQETRAQRMTYAGRPLRPTERVYWSVRIWSSDQEVSEWAHPSEWTMGLPAPADWQAQWIAAPEADSVLAEARWIWTSKEDGLNAAPGKAFFRRSFEIADTSVLSSATLYITADNACRAYLNGKEYCKTAVWQEALSVELTDGLRPGENVLSVEVTNESDVPNPAGLLAALRMMHRDASCTVIATDSHWSALSDMPADWPNAALDAAHWNFAQELGPCGMEPWGPVRTQEHPLPLFRKTFHLEDKPVRDALVYVCGLGHFELSLNGAKVGNHVLDPGWTNYKQTCLYVPFRVTDLVQPGANAFGVMLGNGLYNVVGGRYTKFTGSFGPPMAVLQLHVLYEDGTTTTIGTDDTWKTLGGPITFSCPYGGEDYDARLELARWDTPQFDDSQWNAVHTVPGPGGVLRSQSAPPIVVMDTLAVSSIERHGPGLYEADMGYNLSARPVLKVQGERGSQVTLRVGEVKGSPWEGHSYTYTLRGNGEEVFIPRFTYFGFQYITVEGADLPQDASGERPVLLGLESEFVTSAAKERGAFECSNPLLNEIHAMVARSVRSNLQSVLTDCPHREKLGWLEVAHLMGPSILYHYDVHGLYRKICRDTTEAQLDNGMIPCIAPEYTRFKGGFFESAEWASASVQLPWLLYRWYGDADTLAAQYNTMTRYTEYLAGTRNSDGLAKAGLGDWYDWTPKKGHVGYSQLTPGKLTATAMLFDNARILSATAALLNRQQDAQRFQTLAEEVRRDFIAAYYQEEKGSVATGSQAALAVGLYFGLIPEADRNRVLETLIAILERDAFKPSTGEVCFRYLLLALAEAGRSDLVYNIINRTDCPGYGWMLREFGLKTLSERWDMPGSSLNHCMFGHVQEWFQRHVLGIGQTEDSVAFEKLRIAPEPVGDLVSATGYFDSPRGKISVSWRKEAGQFRMELTIPGNTTAAIILPVSPAAVITEEGGARLETSPTLHNGFPMVHIGSGTYTLACLEPESRLQ